MNIQFKFVSCLCLGFFFHIGFSYPQCRQNEEFQECAPGCPLTCQNHREPMFCTEHCKRGCFCKPGFVLDSYNRCISPEQCPVDSICPENEHYVDCVVPCNDCYSRGQCEEQYCSQGCDCIPGYYRDEYGRCVHEHHCEMQGCGENEVYTECVIPCNDCERKGNCPYNCEYGCDCRKGFYRDSRGICIHEYECYARACGLHEEYKTCGSACPPTCNGLEKPLHCHDHCVAGCFCTSGYVKGPDGKCVRPDECPASCGLYEEYSECGSSCPPACDTLGKSLVCTQQCVKGCFCTKGYVRGPDGKCVRPYECPVACGHNEEYNECGTACPVNCSSLDKSLPCHEHCVHGCFCKSGYIKGPDGKCVKPSECPLDCRPYEEYNECGSACPKTCQNLGKKVHCHDHCVRGCFCVAGYVLGPGGKCVKENECPLTCGPEEIFQEVCSCPEKCPGFEDHSVCPNTCVKDCFCRPGTVRGPNGRCIIRENCPTICKVNEVFEECKTQCERNCTDHHRTSPCTHTCKKGCFCRPGYYRDDQGHCVDPTSCPSECKENEIFLECSFQCEPTCANHTRRNVPCSVQPCRSGCFCASGFVRNGGRCVDPRTCQQDCGENEIFEECSTQCELTCADHHRTTPCTRPCKRGCSCRPGFVRDDRKKCVDLTSCPPECKENEIFLGCSNFQCEPTCLNRTRRNLPCPLTTCQSGCFCASGFVRTADRRCVDPRTCPQVCKQNEEFNECGSPCPPTCSNKNPVCASFCKPGCFCKPGYIKDINGNCVLESECPRECPENEIFRTCGSACPVTCQTLGKSIPCRQQCVRDCFCKDGFVRGRDKKCILPELCSKTCGRNEVFKNCTKPCEPTCTNPISPPNCPGPCFTGCFCKRQYVRDSRQRCILKRRCPKIRPTGSTIRPTTSTIKPIAEPTPYCRINEELKDGNTYCENTCSNGLYIGRCPFNVVEGCYCKNQFFRNNKGDCVPQTMCPRKCLLCSKGIGGRGGGDELDDDNNTLTTIPESSTPLNRDTEASTKETSSQTSKDSTHNEKSSSAMDKSSPGVTTANIDTTPLTSSGKISGRALDSSTETGSSTKSDGSSTDSSTKSAGSSTDSSTKSAGSSTESSAKIEGSLTDSSTKSEGSSTISTTVKTTDSSTNSGKSADDETSTFSGSEATKLMSELSETSKVMETTNSTEATSTSK